MNNACPCSDGFAIAWNSNTLQWLVIQCQKHCELSMHMHVLVSQSSPAIVTKTEEQRPQLGENYYFVMCHFTVSQAALISAMQCLFSVDYSKTNVSIICIDYATTKSCNESCVIVLTDNFTYSTSRQIHIRFWDQRAAGWQTQVMFELHW